MKNTIKFHLKMLFLNLIIAFQIRAANVPIARSAPATVQIRQTVTENGAHIVQHNGNYIHQLDNCMIILCLLAPLPKIQ